MSSARDGLMQAILEHPDDDVPRLIFADWLEENEDSDYAAFIRTQIELSKVPEYDSLWVRHCYARDALTGQPFEQRRPKLPRELGWEPWSFYRGFPARIEVKNVSDFVVHAPELFAVAPICSLNVRSNYSAPPPNLSVLTDSPYLARLRHLNFSLSRLPAQEVERLQDSPHAANLTELEFEFAGIDPSALVALFGPPLIVRLSRLRLHSNEIEWSTLSPAIQNVGGPSRLRSLTASEFMTTFGDTSDVFEAPLLRGLVELDLSGSTLGALGVEALAGSSAVIGLESLGLNKTMPGVPGVKVLAECAALMQLRRLQLANNRLGPVAAKHLARSPHLHNLRVLDMTNNPIGDKGAVALAESPHLRNLVQLELMHCDIGDAGAQALLDSPVTAGLLWLNVLNSPSGTRTSEGMRKRLRKRFGDRVFV